LNPFMLDSFIMLALSIIGLIYMRRVKARFREDAEYYSAQFFLTPYGVISIIILVFFQIWITLAFLFLAVFHVATFHDSIIFSHMIVAAMITYATSCLIMNKTVGSSAADKKKRFWLDSRTEMGGTVMTGEGDPRETNNRFPPSFSLVEKTAARNAAGTAADHEVL